MSEKSAPKAQPEDTEIGEDGMPLTGPGDNVQFTQGGDPSNGEAKVEIGSHGAPTFVGLGKEELMKYANDPFWVRLRWFLFILFWVLWVAMLAGAVIIIVLAPKCSGKEKTSQTYIQIEMRDISTNGKIDADAIVKNLKELGASSVIISNSLKADPKPRGVNNFRDVDEKFGNLEQFKEAINKIKDQNYQVYLDFWPGQTGVKHEWFTKSEDHQNYYIVKSREFATEKPMKMVGKESSAWTTWHNNATDSFYLNRYGSPDLNYKNPKVITEMKDIMKFWEENGVSGFLFYGTTKLIPEFEEDGNNTEVLKQLIEGSSVILELEDIDDENAVKEYHENNLKPIIVRTDKLPENFNAEDLKKLSKFEEYQPIWKVSKAKNPEQTNIILLVTMFLKGGVIKDYEEKESQFTRDLMEVHKDLGLIGNPTDWNITSDGLILKRQEDKHYATIINLSSSESKNITLEDTNTPTNVRVKTPNIPADMKHFIVYDAEKRTLVASLIPPMSGILVAFEP